MEQGNPIFSENPFVYRFVERYNRGPGDFEFSTGIQNKVQIYANSDKSPSSFQHVKRGGDTCRPRSAESSGKGCYRNLFPDPNQFISNIFTILKKDGGRRPVVDM